jgi:tetratricopeptide (TPR) repeat protein
MLLICVGMNSTINIGNFQELRFMFHLRYCWILLIVFAFACADKKFFRQGNAYLKRKEFGQAHGAFDVYVKTNPTMPRAYIKRGYAAWLMGDTLNAYRDMDKVLQLDSLNTLALCNRAYIKQQLGRTQQALDDYNKALQTDKKNADNYLGRASLYFMQGLKDKASEDIAKAMVYGRFSAENFACVKGMHFYFRGISRMKKKEYEGAIIYFTNAIAADSLNARAYYERGLALKAVNDKKGACADLNKARSLGVKIENELFPINCN